MEAYNKDYHLVVMPVNGVLRIPIRSNEWGGGFVRSYSLKCLFYKMTVNNLIFFYLKQGCP